MDEAIVYLNGQYVPASQAGIKIYDLGLVMGATFTEMTRTFRHQTFRLEQHLDRLYHSLAYAGIDSPLTKAQLTDATQQLLSHNIKGLDKFGDLGIVHFVTPGEHGMYAGRPASDAPLQPTVCIHTFRLPFAQWRHFYTEGVHVVTPSVRHLPPECIDPKTKHRSRLHWWVADRQSRAVDPKALSLLLDLGGNITECAGANFLLVKGRTVYSATGRNILQGVSLGMVRELAAQLGLQWVEKDMQPDDVLDADEAWLTTTPYCIAPCTRINGVAISDGRPGPLFGEICRAWSDKVGLDILAQIQNSA